MLARRTLILNLTIFGKQPGVISRRVYRTSVNVSVSWSNGSPGRTNLRLVKKGRLEDKRRREQSTSKCGPRSPMAGSPWALVKGRLCAPPPPPPHTIPKPCKETAWLGLHRYNKHYWVGIRAKGLDKFWRWWKRNQEICVSRAWCLLLEFLCGPSLLQPPFFLTWNKRPICFLFSHCLIAVLLRGEVYTCFELFPTGADEKAIHVSLRLRQVCMRLGNFRDKHTTFICVAFSNIQRLSKYTATSEPHINSILQIIALARSSCADLSWLSVCTWQISRACFVKHIRVLYKIPPIGDWEEKTTPVSASFSLS